MKAADKATSKMKDTMLLTLMFARLMSRLRVMCCGRLLPLTPGPLSHKERGGVFLSLKRQAISRQTINGRRKLPFPLYRGRGRGMGVDFN